MKRILIVGIMASGKSTFAKKLGEKLHLPVEHLDKHYWGPNWTRPTEKQWQDTLQELLSKNEWIIDGNYINTLPLRIKSADTIIMLDYPKWLSVYRACIRPLVVRNNPFDKKEGIKERVGLRLLKKIIQYNSKETITKIKQNITKQRLIILRNDQEANLLLDSIQLK